MRSAACPVPPRRSRRTSMSHTDLGQPDPAALRAAGHAEFAEAESGPVSSCGYPLAGTDPLAPLVRDLARSLTEARFTLHHCATPDPLDRLGGACPLGGSPWAVAGASGAPAPHASA